jgi:EpsI family protein
LTSSETREAPLAALHLGWPGAGVDARATELVTPGARYFTARWYWIDDALTANDYEAKARQAFARLAFRGDDGAGLVLWTQRGDDADEARATLRAFAHEVGLALHEALARTRGGA